MDLHWDTSVGENTLVYGGLIGPFMAQKEFKPLVFILVSFQGSLTNFGSMARPALSPGGDQKGILGWMDCSGHSSVDNKIKWAVDLWRDYCTTLEAETLMSWRSLQRLPRLSMSSIDCSFPR